MIEIKKRQIQQRTVTLPLWLFLLYFLPSVINDIWMMYDAFALVLGAIHG